ncbi:MAG: hypothetical protein H0U70_06415 [Tatlockia sp.]|nr:hypothetical protein [Tatlockia sp.]
MSREKYDPFIHGTTAKTVSLMAQTDFQLMPILWMIDEYYRAPFVGELTNRGYSILGNTKAEEELVGAISFGNAYSGAYRLSAVTHGYTKFTSPNKTEVIEDLNFELKASLSEGFSNINLLLIYLTRARILHDNLNEVISPEELDQFNQQLDAIVQFYYLVQLLGTYIYPNFSKVAQIPKDDLYLFSSNLARALTLERIVKRIIDSKINVQEILLNPTEDNLKKALKLLELPKEMSEESKLSATQFFCLENSSKEFDGYEEAHFGFFSKNKTGYDIGYLLDKFLTNRFFGSIYFQGLSQDSKKHLVALEDRIRIFRKIIAAPQARFIVNDKSQCLSETNYPIILVSESDKIKHHNDSEYRSKTPLKLGEDIRLIATDTKNHQKQLKQYFWSHKVAPVQVILLNELKKGQASKAALPLSIDSTALREMLTKTMHKEYNELFYKFYTLIDELNEKRNKYQGSKNDAYHAHNTLLTIIETEMNKTFLTNSAITINNLNEFCSNCARALQDKKSIFEKHRGIMGAMDTILTILASMIVFYPIVYGYQKYNGISYTFFNTDSGKIAQRTYDTLEKIAELETTEDSSEIVLSEAEDYQEKTSRYI